MGLARYVGWGAVAGAAGSTALNAATYLDMAVRGRPSSSTPEQTAERLASTVGVEVPGEGEQRDNRLAGLGPLLGTAAGVGVGVLFGVLRAVRVRPSGPLGAVLVGGTVMAASDGMMTALGVTDPREWDANAWASDAIPHLVYGAVTVAALGALDRR